MSQSISQMSALSWQSFSEYSDPKMVTQNHGVYTNLGHPIERNSKDLLLPCDFDDSGVLKAPHFVSEIANHPWVVDREMTFGAQGTGRSSTQAGTLGR